MNITTREFQALCEFFVYHAGVRTSLMPPAVNVENKTRFMINFEAAKVIDVIQARYNGYKNSSAKRMRKYRKENPRYSRKKVK